MFLIFFIFLKILIEKWINWHEYWGSDASLDTKINQIEKRHIPVSYASFVIIWHFMSYDTYDIIVWRFSIWLILESKEASESQYSCLLIHFWITFFGKTKKLEKVSEKISLYEFFTSFVFFDQSYGPIWYDEEDS